MAGSVGSEDGDVGFQIAPMVDVVFVLLLFFMLCLIIVQAVKDLVQLMMKITDLLQKKFCTIIKVIFNER